jgi:hypothetical protein
MWSSIVTSPYLKPARHDDVELTGPDELVGQRDGVDPRQAHLVDRERGDVHGDSGADRRLPRRNLPGASGEYLPHDHVLDLVGSHAGTLERRLDRERAELSPAEVLQTAQQPPHRGAGSSDDHGSGHDDLQRLRWRVQ